MELSLEMMVLVTGAIILAAVVALNRRMLISLIMIVFIFVGLPILPNKLSAAASLGRWLMLALGSGIGVAAFLTGNKSPRQMTRLHLILLILNAAMFLSCITSLSPVYALAKTLSFSLLCIFLMVQRDLYTNPKERIHIILQMLLLVSEFMAWGSIILSLIHPSMTIITGNYRGIAGNANYLGAKMGIFGIPIALHLLFEARTVPSRFRYGIDILVFLVCLFASNSRAGVLAGLVGGLIILNFRVSRGAFVFIAILIVVAGISTYIFRAGMIDVLTKRLIYKGRSTIMFSRSEHWQKDIADILERPFLGSGFGVPSGTSAGWSRGFSSFGALPGRTNSYLAIPAQMGLIGTIPALILLIHIIIPNLSFVRRIGRRTDDEAKVATLFVAILLGGLANAFFEAWLLAVGNPIAVMFWLTMNLLEDIRIRYGMSSAESVRKVSESGSMANASLM